MFENIEVFDFETVNNNKKPKPIMVIWSEEGKFRYIDLTVDRNEKILNWILCDLNSNKVYYAHNLLFDFSFILPELLRVNIKFNWICVDYRLYSVTITRPDNTIVYLKCSVRLIPLKLSGLGELFKTKPKITFPYEELTNKKWKLNGDIYIQDGGSVLKKKLKSGLLLYAKRDCEILLNVMKKFYAILKPLMGDTLVPKHVHSMGGLAINLFVKKYNNMGLVLNIPKSEMRELRKSYRGGRCEIFGNRMHDTSNIRHFDFEGMYQRCIEGRFPINRLLFTEEVKEFKQPGFYYIRVSCLSELPVLPIKQDKLFFAEGRIEGLFWYEEIRLALEENKIIDIEILYAWLARDYEPALSSFAEETKKLKTSTQANKIIKYLVNSLYGRFGMSTSYARTDIVDRSGGADFSEYAQIVLENKTIEQKNLKANIAIASIITSRARIKLYKAMKAVLKIPHSRLLYVDTDSIIAEFTKNKTPDNVHIGAGVTFNTNKSDTCISDAVFIAPKTYALLLENGQSVVKIKGINEENIKFNRLKQAFYDKERVFLQKSSLKKEGFYFKQDTQDIKITTDSYDKRIWSSDLKKTKPIRINMY